MMGDRRGEDMDDQVRTWWILCPRVDSGQPSPYLCTLPHCEIQDLEEGQVVECPQINAGRVNKRNRPMYEWCRCKHLVKAARTKAPVRLQRAVSG